MTRNCVQMILIYDGSEPGCFLSESTVHEEISQKIQFLKISPFFKIFNIPPPPPVNASQTYQ